MVWHGAGLLFEAGQAFQQGDPQTGGPPWTRALHEMEAARRPRARLRHRVPVRQLHRADARVRDAASRSQDLLPRAVSASCLGERTTILEVSRVSHFFAKAKLTFAVVSGRASTSWT
jgi:hypothetical protein